MITRTNVFYGKGTWEFGLGGKAYFYSYFIAAEETASRGQARRVIAFISGQRRRKRHTRLNDRYRSNKNTEGKPSSSESFQLWGIA
jgi:hypothetical protein